MSAALSVMLWPLVACLALPGILVYYGLHIVRREVIFVDLALAQVAALGFSLAVLLGHGAHDPAAYGLSLVFTFIGAAIFTLTRMRDRRVPQEALIGIVYVVAAAAGILVLSQSAEGNEELRRTLVGDVLLVRGGEVWRTFALYAAIGAVHFAFRRQFLKLSFQPERAFAEGMAVRGWDFAFYALFGLVVTSFVQIGGVLLVFSYLIVPAVVANLLVGSLAARLAAGWITATLGSVLGLGLSYALDLPTGAAIVCVLGGLLLAGGLAARLGRRLSATGDAGSGAGAAGAPAGTCSARSRPGRR
ncbi:MAG: metal ABC transporter permease [Candidatus Latescibacterota bacterium]